MHAASKVCATALCVAFIRFGSAAQQQFPAPALVAVRPIEAPSTGLPPEGASATQTRFSFIAYGDTRSQVDGQQLQPDHAVVVNAMLAKIRSLASTRFPVRFIVQSGDAVSNGTIGDAWNTSFVPIIDRMTRGANMPYLFAAGNHDVAFAGEASRPLGLHNLLSATAKLIPPEGSARRLAGYPTFGFGYGNVFMILIDSNVPADPLQLAWVTDQLEHLDRGRYRHVVAVFHHPMFSSGPHGGAAPGAPVSATDDNVERPTAEMRKLYAPIFRRFHVRMTITGHEHLFEHWVERYSDAGTAYRRDDVVSGGGGAPIYTYRGEPETQKYLAAGAGQTVRLEHVVKPGMTAADNPHHFIVIQVDGNKLSLEVVGARTEFKPYAGKSQIELN